MSIIDKYNNAKLTANPVSDSTKLTSAYLSALAKSGSPIVKQTASPTKPTTLAQPKGFQDYTAEVFKESLA